MFRRALSEQNKAYLAMSQHHTLERYATTDRQSESTKHVAQHSQHDMLAPT